MLFANFSDVVFAQRVAVPLRRLIKLNKKDLKGFEGDEYKNKTRTLGSFSLLVEACETKSGTAAAVMGFSTTVQSNVNGTKKKKRKEKKCIHQGLIEKKRTIWSYNRFLLENNSLIVLSSVLIGTET